MNIQVICNATDNETLAFAARELEVYLTRMLGAADAKLGFCECRCLR